jgi:transcriptional regulator with GAF, ATPase, and Fis domain
VLVLGESGTGKELVANAIHRHGSRADGPLVKVHCAALTESLLESELFGHEKGAFTGAIARHVGRFERAQHGTLFLDEIGEVPPSVQIKLLRVLQEHAFERVGGNETVQVDVRLIAATNRDLTRSVAAGTFRADLFYRLNVVPIRTPALREHPEDLSLLAYRFLDRCRLASAKAISGFSGEALAALVRHAWPGNVRELENALEYAVVMTAAGSAIPISALPPSIVQPGNSPRSARPTVPGATLGDIERHAILATLESCGGCTIRAARALGISARKIQYRLQAYHGARRSGVDAVANNRSHPR